MSSPSKKWYFATTKNLTLQQIPDLTAAFTTVAASLNGRFLGNPSKLLGPDADAPEEEDSLDEEGNPKPKTVRFSEAHRLAYVLNSIDHDTGLVPKGAYIVNPTHYVTENNLFIGLNATEATDLSSYYHFRKAEHPLRANSLYKPGLVAATDFLDPASEDTPSGSSWSVRLDSGKATVELRSLKWPGYFFLHSLGTPKYGGVYIGDGQENKDVSFML